MKQEHIKAKAIRLMDALDAMSRASIELDATQATNPRWPSVVTQFQRSVQSVTMKWRDIGPELRKLADMY